MSRPFLCRRVTQQPGAIYFKPRGIRVRDLEEVVLAFDEFEALRLADKEGMYQDQAAERMKISRATFGRIIEAARRKVADALVRGRALKIEGGNFQMAKTRTFLCNDCGYTWQEPCGTGRPAECPGCHKDNFCRADRERGSGCEHRDADRTRDRAAVKTIGRAGAP